MAFLHNMAEAEAEDGDVHISQQVEDLEVAVPAQDTTIENTTENGDVTNKYQEENVCTSGVTTVENTTENSDGTSEYREENVSDADGTQHDTSYASDRFVPESIDVKKLPSSHQHRISFASSVGSASDCAHNSTWNARKTRKSQIGKLGLKLHNRRQSDCSASSTDYSARKSMWTK